MKIVDTGTKKPLPAKVRKQVVTLAATLSRRVQKILRCQDRIDALTSAMPLALLGLTLLGIT